MKKHSIEKFQNIYLLQIHFKTLETKMKLLYKDGKANYE